VIRLLRLPFVFSAHLWRSFSRAAHAVTRCSNVRTGRCTAMLWKLPQHARQGAAVASEGRVQTGVNWKVDTGRMIECQVMD
jgi:hypothetical protein